MTIAAKHFDPLVGIDIHIILIPTPGPPIPTPLPNPYVGMVFDPFDYAPFIGATVYVNSVPRAVAGTNGKALAPHIPMGGPFMKTPSMESEIFMGSATVLFDGDPQSFLGLPVLSCQDIGMPPPPRPKKKKVATTLMLPTTVVLSIPMGMLVLIGGPPTISMMAIAGKLGLGALKKLRAGKLGRKLSKKLNKLAKKLCDKLKLGKLARKRISKIICVITGHPVDVATGKVFTDSLDFGLEGPIPFEWERTWYSCSTYAGPLGHGWHHTYDQTLYLDAGIVLYQAADGRHIGFPELKPGGEHYERAEKLTLLRDQSGAYSIRDQEGLVRRFLPVPGRSSDNHPLREISDEVGNRVRLNYDARGRLAQIIDSADRSIEIVSDQQDRIVAVTAPHPDQPGQRVYVVRYAYDSVGNLTTVWDALGQPMQYAYLGHLLARETDRRGFSFYFNYDRADDDARCTRTWGDGGIYDHKLSYDADAGTTLVENSLGQRTLHKHREGLVVESVDALGGTTLAEYDDHDEIQSETDPLGQVTTFAYDARGNVSEMVLPSGAKVSAEYDANDAQVRLVDELGGEWKFARDASGRLLEATNPKGAVTRYHHDSRNLIGMTDAIGGHFILGYDAAGNLREITQPDGSTTRYEHNGWGRIITLTDPSGNVERRNYDLLSRIVRVDEPDGNARTFEFDPESNVTRASDVSGETTYTHQGTGRLATCTQSGLTVHFQYDTEEQLVAILNEHGSVFQFELDPLGRVAVESGFDGVMRKFIFNAADHVIRVERPAGQTSDYTYDPVGNVLTVSHSDGLEEACAYREDGQLTSVTFDGVIVEFELDELGHVTKEARDAHWVQSEYDAVGQRTRVRSSFGLDKVIEYDLSGEAASVRDAKSQYETRFVRDRLGFELERQMPGGLKSTWQRDRLGRPLQHTVEAQKNTLRAVSFQWEPDGRLRKLIDGFRGPTEFGHDALGNLAWSRYPNQQIQTRMPDAIGNLFRSTQRNDRGYGPAGQLLWSLGPTGTTHYAYDAEGYLVEKREPSGRVWRYEWNGAGRLAKVVRPDGSEVTFAYDGLGRRVRKTYRGQSTHWVWDGNVPLHEWVEGKLEPLASPVTAPVFSTDADTNKREAELQQHLTRGPPEHGTEKAPITWLFEPESFAPMAKLTAAGNFSIVTNDLGTPVLMVDATGTAVWGTELDSYGEPRDMLGNRQACPFRYPGQYEDAETGLYYNRFRYYDPDAGEYISQDPFALLAGLRLYAYVNDPNAWVDPLGLDLTNKQMGQAAERAAKQRLRSQKQTVIGSIENTSGHGVDVVTRNKAGQIEVHEVKANSSRLSKLQKKGPDAYAKRQAKRAMADGFKHRNEASRKAAAALSEAIESGQKITGKVHRYRVNKRTGKVRAMGPAKPWKKCK